MKYRYCFPFIVEDDDDDAILLRRALLKAGVPEGNVHRYRNGESALADLVSNHAVRPTFLLLDLELPGMSGLSLLERVRSCDGLAQTPAFLLSGRDDDGYVATALALGARGCWVKPYRNGTLQEIVRGVLDSLDHPEASTS